MDAGLAGDLELQARWALAAGLDGLARFAEADDLWTWLATANWTPTSAQRIAFDVAWARAMLARGRLAEAKSILDGVLTIPPPVSVPADADQVNAARIEMARLLLWTTKKREGGKLAESVARYYRDLGSPGHAQCIAAELLWAEAAFALNIFEPLPDRTKWAEAEKLLDQLAENLPLETAEQSFHASAVSVQRGLVLLWRGKPAKCLETLLPALPALRQRLGASHPLVLRAEYAVAMAHCQLGNWADGADLLSTVWPAQRALIGPMHPDTLDSQLQYGIALWYANRGDDKRAKEIVREVCRIMPKEVGRMSDLSQQAWIAQILLPWIPHWFTDVIQAINRPLAEGRRRGP